MKNSKIEWCDHTFNPWIGCTKVSPGCAHCYAETRDQRFAGGIHWGPGAPRQRTSADNWKQPLAWNKTAICKCGGAELIGSDDCRHCGENFDPSTRRRPRVFCASLADWLDDEVPIEWLADLLDLIRRTPNLDWLLLTKRPENWRKRLEQVWDARTDETMELAAWVHNWKSGDDVPANVWIGTTVENQAMADKRLPALLSIPAKVRFLSCEPLLGELYLTRWLNPDGRCEDCGELIVTTPESVSCGCCSEGPEPTLHRNDLINWVIVGGESGPKARGFCVEYAWDVVLQCRNAGVPVFVKQLGANPYTSNANAMEWPDYVGFESQGEGACSACVSLNHKKGADFEEFPTELQVREFPEATT